MLEKSPLKWENGGGDHCCCPYGTGEHLFAHSFQMKNDRNVWLLLLNRAKNVVYESSITFSNRSKDTRENPSQS